MAQFLTSLKCEKVQNTDDTWLLLEELIYQSDIVNKIIVPNGFQTDFASTPQLVWTFFPKSGIWDSAAVIHDFSYTNKSYPRKRCDEVFLEAMKVLNVPILKRYIMFLAVRAFGWKAY